MAAHRITINTSGAPTASNTNVVSGDTVTWHNDGSKAVTVSFSSSWPFTGTSVAISVPGSGDSSTYTAKSIARNQNDSYDVERDGETTGSGEIDLGVADDFDQPTI